MTVLHLLQPSLYMAMLSLPQYDHRGSPDFRRDAYERSYVVFHLMSEIGRVETRHLTRRGAARLDLTSTRTMRRCPWRLVMGRLLRFNVLRMDASRSVSSARDDAAGRESLVIIASATVDVPTGGTRL